MEQEPKLGGRFIEKGKNGEAALWEVITYIIPYREIWIDGALGMLAVSKATTNISLKKSTHLKPFYSYPIQWWGRSIVNGNPNIKTAGADF